MSSIYDYISGSLGGRITSTRRDPNSRLGRANPRSYHNIGQAVDVAPIPGLDFPQYVQKLKDAGYQILEARDEVNNPSPHATGPHWHVAFGKQSPKPETAMQLNPSLYPLNLGQPDPMGPMESPIPQQGIAGIIQQQPNMAAMSQPNANGRDPLAPKPGAFDKGGTGWVIAGIIADAIAGGFGGRGGFAPTYLASQENDRQDRLYREKVAAEREERMRPRLMQAGGAILSVDPATNQVTPVYQEAPEPPEATTLQRNIEMLKQLRPDLSDGEAFEIAKAAVVGSQGNPRPFTYSSGDKVVTEMLNPDGSRTPVASAPRWQPKSPSDAASKLPPGFILD